MRPLVGLAALATSCHALSIVPGAVQLSRRAAAVLLPCAVLPTRALAAARAALPLEPELVLILRVQEATAQETRLIKTGKYKELQRLNIKRAVRFLLDNYELQQRFVNAASYAPRSRVVSAGSAGNAAAEALIQILEYFPQDLTANSLSPEQARFVLAALSACSRSIDEFLALMPPEAVEKAQAQVAEENRLNELELVDEDGNKAIMINPPPRSE